MASNKSWYTAQSIGDRKAQEDACDAFVVGRESQSLICLLADGMGGHAAGDVAAQLTVSKFKSEIVSAVADGFLAHDSFLDALDTVNRSIAGYAAENPEAEGMGCTLVCAQIEEAAVRWVSVGDSLLYSVGSSGLKRLNADHSMAPRLDAAARRGEISWEEAKSSPQRNALLSALTGDPIGRVDVSREAHPLDDGEWLLVASDGLDTLDEKQILACFESEHGSQSAETIGQALIQAVADAQRPRQDNTTVIVVGPVSSSTPIRDFDNEVITRPLPVR